jgi:hypothetical protein
VGRKLCRGAPDGGGGGRPAGAKAGAAAERGRAERELKWSRTEGKLSVACGQRKKVEKGSASANGRAPRRRARPLCERAPRRCCTRHLPYSRQESRTSLCVCPETGENCPRYRWDPRRKIACGGHSLSIYYHCCCACCLPQAHPCHCLPDWHCGYCSYDYYYHYCSLRCVLYCC